MRWNWWGWLLSKWLVYKRNWISPKGCRQKVPHPMDWTKQRQEEFNFIIKGLFIRLHGNNVIFGITAIFLNLSEFIPRSTFICTCSNLSLHHHCQMHVRKLCHGDRCPIRDERCWHNGPHFSWTILSVFCLKNATFGGSEEDLLSKDYNYFSLSSAEWTT